MPIYEYKCLQCGVHLEKRQSVSDLPLTVCEKCGGELEKQISLSGFQFKGGGWYVTEYAGSSRSAAPAAEKSGGGSTSGSDAASNTKSESATAKSD